METKNNTSYIPVTAAAGAVGGAFYGFKHPGEKSCLKISKLTPNIIDTMTEYKDSFNLETAKIATAEGKLQLNEYSKAENIVNSISEVIEKEQKVKEVLNTPFEQRTTTLKSATKEANALRPKMYKAFLEMTTDFQNKLVELNIFDKEKFSAATKEAKGKAVAVWKELSKGAAKGLAVGVAAGAALGYWLNSITKNKPETK